MYGKIIVAVNVGDLEKGERILRKAATLRDTGGEIILLNVVEDLPNYMAIEVPVDLIGKALHEARERLVALKERVGVVARVEIRSGAPAREILAAAQDVAADLIVVASHIPDLSNYFIGATADRIVRHAKCSVLVDRS